MKRNILKRTAGFLIASIILISSAITSLAGEQLGATDFDDGVGLPWHIVESATGKMDFRIENGVYEITIINPGGASNGGEDRWDCQFRHRGLKIVSGHQYHVQYEITASNSGKFYTKIGTLDGKTEVWHNMSDGYNLDQTWDPINIQANQTMKVDLTFTANQSIDVAEWAFHLGGDGQYTNGGCFPAGTVITFDNMSLIDLTSDENDYVPEPQWERAGILVNQTGYFTGCAKRATLLSDSSSPVSFHVIDSSGKSVFDGKSDPMGFDEDSGDNVHVIDFTGFDGKGTFHIESDDGSKSWSFTIGDANVYSNLLYDSLNYFYQNRSGIAIDSSFISSGDKDKLSRAAGHAPDNATVLQTWGYSGSSGSQDVTGGWYDAGDHGKYVVNGGISLWLLQNEYEMAMLTGTQNVFADGTMNIPESGNGYPDLLDESRWEMEWMIKMLVADGEYRDMAYHKVHDEKWTGLGLAPADDTLNRVLLPPTTAATLNVSACAAQAARLWKGIDDSFAQECLDVAVRTYEAALKHPSMFAPLGEDDNGGGAYGDDDVSDDFYWAACELYITTGDARYKEDMKASQWYLKVPVTLGGGESVDTYGSFDWGHTAALGTLSCSLNKKLFGDNENDLIRDAVKSAADTYIKKEASQGYGQPYAQSTLSYENANTGYIWGSNSIVSDNSIVMAYAYMLTGEGKYLDGAIGGLDYLLGRNPMDISYVTGYGYHAAQNPHHRFWANQIDTKFPSAPSGVLVGGPNCGMEDPWVQGSGWHYGQIPAAKCYLDNIEAYSVNECTINWNAPLTWLVAFIASNSDGITVTDREPVFFEKPEVTPVPSTTPEDMVPTLPSGNGDPVSETTPGGNIVSNITPVRSTDPVNEDDLDNDGDGGSEKRVSLEDDEVSGTTVILIIVIAGIVLVAVISTEIFVYKMAKLKRDTKS